MKKHGMDFYKPRIELFWKSDLLEALRPGLRLTSDVMAVLKPSSSVFSRWANRIAFGMFCQSDLALSGFRKPDNFPENVQKFSDKMFVKIFSIENFQPWKFSALKIFSDFKAENFVEKKSLRKFPKNKKQTSHSLC